MRLFIGAFCAALSIAVTASAQSCGGIYKIRVGQRLNLPCINGLPTGLEGGVSTAAQKPAPVPVEIKQVKVAQMQSPRALRVNLLTADDYAPFTDRNSLNDGWSLKSCIRR